MEKVRWWIVVTLIGVPLGILAAVGASPQSGPLLT
jgi:predicted membrane-bound mannosyltransferase